eukprot:11167041-Prorocentrum_lima.AAC.1
MLSTLCAATLTAAEGSCESWLPAIQFAVCRRTLCASTPMVAVGGETVHGEAAGEAVGMGNVFVSPASVAG